MSLETLVDYLDDLQSADPDGGDVLSQADDHMRNIKKSLKQTFPGAAGQGFARALVAFEDDIDLLAGANAAGLTAAQLLYLAGVTAGTAAASKALVLDALKDITGINELTAVSLIGALTGNSAGVHTGAVIGNADTATNAANSALLDNLDSTDFARSNAVDTISAAWTFTANIGLDGGWDIGGTTVNSTATQINFLTASGLVLADFTKLADITASAAEINDLTGNAVDAADFTKLSQITSTAIELNNVDGITSAIATTVAAGDRVVYNDNGVMKQVDVDDIDTYFSQTNRGLTNKAMVEPLLLQPLVTANSEEMTSGGESVFGMKILDTPESVLSSTSDTSNAFVTVGSIATLVNASAKAAILRITIEGEDASSGTNISVSAHVRKTGSGLAIGYVTRILTDADDNNPAQTGMQSRATGECVVNLDASQLFDYATWVSGASNKTVEIYLVGYYT